MAANAGARYNPSLFISAAGPESVNDAGSTSPWAIGQLGQWTYSFPLTSYWTTFALGSRPLKIMYVQRSSTDDTTLAVGAAAFVKDEANFIFTAKASDSLSTANNIYNCKGVFLGSTLAAGNYGFIAIGGIAPLLLKGSPTVAADATGALMAVPEASTNTTFDCISSATFAAAADADKIRRVVGRVLSVKNTPSGIGTDVVKAELFPYGGVQA